MGDGKNDKNKKIKTRNKMRNDNSTSE